MDSLGKAHASGLSQPLQPSGNIHALAQQVAAANRNIAEMHADPKPEAAILARSCIRSSKPLLDRYGALHRINCTRKFRQHAVPSRIGDPAPVLGDKAVHHRASRRQGA
jgi:hypothetical protein